MNYTNIFLEQLDEFTNKTGQTPETIYMSYEMFSKLAYESGINISMSAIHEENITNCEVLGYKVRFAEFEEGKTKVVFSIV